ncbi:hypothetical protein KY362_06825 [Candidatus Woesearchaeota archaeon]|nr:hypothetical protein [Candidatus Woesearchaeota archaeon]
MAESVDDAAEVDAIEGPSKDSMCDGCRYLEPGDCYSALCTIDLDDLPLLEQFFRRQPEDGKCSRFYRNSGLDNARKIAMWMIDPERAKGTIYDTSSG